MYVQYRPRRCEGNSFFCVLQPVRHIFHTWSAFTFEPQLPKLSAFLIVTINSFNELYRARKFYLRSIHTAVHASYLDHLEHNTSVYFEN